MDDGLRWAGSLCIRIGLIVGLPAVLAGWLLRRRVAQRTAARAAFMIGVTALGLAALGEAFHGIAGGSLPSLAGASRSVTRELDPVQWWISLGLVLFTALALLVAGPVQLFRLWRHHAARAKTRRDEARPTR